MEPGSCRVMTAQGSWRLSNGPQTLVLKDGDPGHTIDRREQYILMRNSFKIGSSTSMFCVYTYQIIPKCVYCKTMTFAVVKINTSHNNLV